MDQQNRKSSRTEIRRRKKQVEMRRKKQRRRVAFRLTIFFLIVGILITGAVSLAWNLIDGRDAASDQKSNSFQIKERTGYYLHPYYFEEENSIDGFFLGSSTSYRLWVGPTAFHETGIAVYGWTAKGLHPLLFKYMIEDILESQDPKVIVINLGNFPRFEDSYAEENITRVTDHMKDGPIRDEAIESTVNMFKENGLDNMITDLDWYDNPTDEEVVGYERIRGKEDREYVDRNSKYKGFMVSIESTQRDTYGEVQPLVDYTSKINDVSEEILYDLLDYCKTIDPEVIFVVPPANLEADAQARLNMTAQIVEENGFEVFNTNTEDFREEIGLDPLEDFYDPRHVNAYGGIKFTKYFAEYLQEKYDLEDHRDDESYNDWERAYDEMMAELGI